MRYFKIYLILLVIPLWIIFAQPGEWSLDLMINPYPSPYYADWEIDPSIGVLQVHYTGTEPATCRLFARVFQERYDQLAYGESKNLQFFGPETKILNNTEFIDFDKLEYPEDMKTQIERTGRLPEGRYTLCIEARTDDGETVVAEKCMDFYIAIPNAPRLVFPTDSIQISNSNPLFQWTPPSVPSGYPTNYRVKIWRNIENRSAEEIVENTEPIYTQEISETNQMLYPMSAPPFEEGKTYIWRVELASRDGFSGNDIDRMSEIGKFVYRHLPQPVEQNLPDTLLIGDFVLVVTKYESGSTLEDMSGKAELQRCDDSITIVIPIWHLGQLQNFQIIDISGNNSNENILDTANITQNTNEITTTPQLANSSMITNTPAINNPNIGQIDTNIILGGTGISSSGAIIVNFEHLSAETVSANVGKVTGGSIDEKFVVPVVQTIKGFKVAFSEIYLSPDSASAVVTVYMPGLIDSSSCQSGSIGPFKTQFDNLCNIYAVISASDSLANKSYGLCDMGIYMRATDSIVVDLSTKKSYGSMPADTSLIIFTKGKTFYNDSISMSNTGYLYGDYTFTKGSITPWGFSAKLFLKNNFKFTTISPTNFVLSLTSDSSSYIDIKNCRITDGSFAGNLSLPIRYVKTSNGDTLKGNFSSLTLDSALTLTGHVRLYSDLCWGGFSYRSTASGSNGAIFRIYSGPERFYEPVSGDSFNVDTTFVRDSLTGLTIFMDSSIVFTPYDTFYVHSQDCKTALAFGVWNDIRGWLNVGMGGVTGKFKRGRRFRGIRAQLGNTKSPDYVDDTTFNTTLGARETVLVNNEKTDTSMSIDFTFAGNSSFDSDISGKLSIPRPCSLQGNFYNMNVTSTANLVGGNFKFDAETLFYWGLNMASKRGLISVKTGQIIFTNAAISESLHYSGSFKVIWGEMRPSGDIGTFIFDENTSGIKFDGFPITLDSAWLSKYNDSLSKIPISKWPKKQGGFMVKADIHFPFFGNLDTFITLQDYKYNDSLYPYSNRLVQTNPHYFALPARTWGVYHGNALAYLDFDSLTYDSLLQEGFKGVGTLDYKPFKIPGDTSKGLPMNATLDAKRDGIRLCIKDNNDRDYNPTGAIGNLGLVNDIWGCMYIKSDTVRSFVIGGKMGETSGAFIVGSQNNLLLFKDVVTPTITATYIEGMAELDFLNDKFQLFGKIVFQTKNDRVHSSFDGFFEGKFNGKYDGNEIGDIAGKINIHAGLDYFFIQGTANVSLFDMISAQGGIFIGAVVPASKVWVFNEGGKFGKFGLNKSAFGGSDLTGLYVFGDFSENIEWGIIDGGFETFLGLGAVVATGGTGGFTLIGNGGIYIYGDIFWGLVSASAWGNVQLLVGYPISMEGTLGLEGCVLWVVCKSVDITVGFNQNGVYYDW